MDAVENGQAALQALKEKSYDVIVSDLKMPEMDGQELYARLTADAPHLISRIIFTTGDTVSAETRSFLERTGRPYLFKPFKVKDLVEQADRLILAQRPPADPLA